MRFPWQQTESTELASCDPWIIVGLGNPGPRYAETRHNLGFRVVDLLAERHHLTAETKKYRALVGSGRIRGHPVLLLKPQTFMNDSGKAVRSAAQFRKASLDRIVVIVDDLDLPLGRVRVRPQGSAGGHGGLKSIMQLLGSQEFGRVRIGIGRPDQGDVVDFVLTPFHATEVETVAAACRTAADAVEEIVAHGFESAMRVVNR